MRKYLILAAASLSLMLTLSACSGSDKQETSPAATTTEIVIEFDSETEPESSPEESAAASSEALELNDNQDLAEENESQAGENLAEETTTEMPVYKVTPMDKTMYAIKPVNVRAGYTTGTAVLSSLKAGQEVEVTGMAENGWIQIKFNGGEAYVYKSYLSESKDDVETTASTESRERKETKENNASQDPNNPAVSTSQTATEPATAPESAPVPVTIPPSPIS